LPSSILLAQLSDAVSLTNRRLIVTSASVADNLQIRLCAPDQVPALMQFIDRHWRSGHILSRDEALLRWQFAPGRLPAEHGQDLSVLLAQQGEMIVGMLGLIPFQFNLLGRRIAGAWLANWLALDEVPGAGLTLMDAARKLGCQARFAFGTGQAVEGLYGRMGFETLKRCPRWVGVLDPMAAEQLVACVNPGVAAAEVHAAVAEHWVGEQEGQPGSVLRWPGPFGAEWDDCWRMEFAPRLLGGCRDAAYLNWRYVEHPRFQYEKIVTINMCSGRQEALAIYRLEQVRDWPAKVLRIVEFLGQCAAAKLLAQEIVAAGRRDGAAMADFYCTCPAAAAGLEAVGFRGYEFLPGRPRMPARFQPLEDADDAIRGAFHLAPQWREETGPLLARPDFYVTKSDDDMDRPN
jgi:hypothetical protein